MPKPETTATCEVTDAGLVLNSHTFVIKNEAGKIVAMTNCDTRDAAIQMFCYPDDKWADYETVGYTCERKLDA